MKKIILILAIVMFSISALAETWDIKIANGVSPWDCTGNVLHDTGGYTECYPVSNGYTAGSYTQCLCFKPGDLESFFTLFEYDPSTEGYAPKCMASGMFNGFYGTAEFNSKLLTHWSSPTSCRQNPYGPSECCGVDCFYDYDHTGKTDSAGWPICDSSCNVSCNACDNPTAWTGTVLQTRLAGGTCTGATCNNNGTCSSRRTEYRCIDGYYLSGTTCISCATATGNPVATCAVGSTSISNCYIPKGTAGTDASGSFTYVENCHY